MQITIDLKELQDYEAACQKQVKDLVLFTMSHSPVQVNPASFNGYERNARMTKEGLELAYNKFPFPKLIPTV